MTSEILSVPEQHLKSVIKVIRAGLKAVKVPKEVKEALLHWCEEEENYLEDSHDRL